MSSTLVTPLLISEPFGNSAANPTYINLPILVPDQTGTTINRASFETGFPPNTMTPETSGGLPFFGQDMNGILWMITAYSANFAAGALSSYNSTLSTAISGYPLGAVLVNGNGDGLWVSQVDGNVTDPDTGGAGWLPFGGVGETSVTVGAVDITLSALQAALPFISLVGTLGANINVIFPVNTGQSWIMANETTGAFTVTAKTASGTGVSVPATGAAAPTSIYCDDTNIQNTGVSTAGLAPINSPHLTGTPTAPTASPATTNTTQIATTAFVQAAITAALSGYAHLASPIFSGVPTVPTAAPGTSTLQIASTAFVENAVAPGARSLTGNGYTTLPGGVILQWGFISVAAFAAANIVFPLPFPNACFSVSANTNRPGSGSGGYNQVFALTRLGFTAYFDANAGTSSGYWMAVGH